MEQYIILIFEIFSAIVLLLALLQLTFFLLFFIIYPFQLIIDKLDSIIHRKIMRWQANRKIKKYRNKNGK